MKKKILAFTLALALALTLAACGGGNGSGNGGGSQDGGAAAPSGDVPRRDLPRPRRFPAIT